MKFHSTKCGHTIDVDLDGGEWQQGPSYEGPAFWHDFRCGQCSMKQTMYVLHAETNIRPDATITSIVTYGMYQLY